MKVPVSIGKWLTNNGYHNVDENWRRIDGNCFLIYVCKRKHYYLVTVSYNTGLWILEILKRHGKDVHGFFKQGNSKKLKYATYKTK